MKINNLLEIVFFIIVSPCMLYASTAYFVDFENGNDTNDGKSANNAWKTIGKVNSYMFSTGDDVYFKCGETWSGTQLTIDWNGSVNDQAIIGAYYNDGGAPVFGVSGARPIIDGNNWTVPGSAGPLVKSVNNTGGYITIKDLYVKHSKYYGITIKNSGTDNLIENCYIYRPKKQGILLIQTSDSTITRCTVEESSYLTSPGGGIVVMGFGVEGTADNNIVSYNTVFHCYEGINGVTSKARYTIMEYNHIYDNRSINLYLQGGKYGIARYNLVYSSSDVGTWGGAEKGIAVDMESYYTYCYSGGHEIYGNFVAGASDGIALLNQYQRVKDNECTLDDNLIYNNTIVDSVANNIRVQTGPDQGAGDQSAWSGNEIKNNISWTITSGSKHVYDPSVAGVAWSHNLFDEAVSGNAMTNAVIGNPGLTKTSGWRSIAPGSLTPNDFKLSNTGSAAYNTGTDLGGTPYNLDYWGTNRDSNAPWDIGAHEYSSAPVDNVDPQVTNFVVTPTTINQGQNITANYSMNDNIALASAELWRAPDNSGSPGTWTKLKTNSHSGTSVSDSFTDTPPAAGVFWYGMHAVDAAGNWAPASPHGPDKVTVNGDTTPPDAPTMLEIIE